MYHKAFTPLQRGSKGYLTIIILKGSINGKWQSGVTGNSVAPQYLSDRIPQENLHLLGNYVAVRFGCFAVQKSSTMEPSQYDRLLSYIRSGQLPSYLTKNEKASLRRKSEFHCEGRLFVLQR